MWLTVNVNQVNETWAVVIEGQARTSYTYCTSRREAEDLGQIARRNPAVAEKLHGVRD